MTNSPYTSAPTRPGGWTGLAALTVIELMALGILLWWLLGGTFPVEVLWLIFGILGFAIAGLPVVCNAQRRDGAGGPSALGWAFAVVGMLCWVAAPVPTWLAGWPFFAVVQGNVLFVLGLVCLALMAWAFIAQRRRIRFSNERPIEGAWIAPNHGPRFNPPPMVPPGRNPRLVGFSICMTMAAVLLVCLIVDGNVGPGKYPGALVVAALAVASWAVLVGERWPVPGPRPLGWVFIAVGWGMFALVVLWMLLGASTAGTQRAAIILVIETLLIGALTFWGWTRQRAWIAWYFGSQQQR